MRLYVLNTDPNRIIERTSLSGPYFPSRWEYRPAIPVDVIGSGEFFLRNFPDSLYEFDSRPYANAAFYTSKNRITDNSPLDDDRRFERSRYIPEYKTARIDDEKIISLGSYRLNTTTDLYVGRGVFSLVIFSIIFGEGRRKTQS